MKSLIYLLGVLVLSIYLTIPAEGQIYLSNEAIFEEAEEYLNSDEFVEALPLYLMLEKKGIVNAHIAYKTGTCYLNTRGKKHLSIPYLETAAEEVSDSFQNVFSELKAPVKALLLLGVAYRIDGRLDDAIAVFNDLKQRIEKTDPDYVAIVDLHIERCNNAKLLNAFPNEPRTDRLPDQINTEFSNYNPVLVGHDSLLYYMEELKFYDAVMKVRMKEGKWGTPENLTPAIGSDGDHILVGSTPDGKKLLLYFYEPLRAGELYSTEWIEDKGWSKIKPLNENINTVYHETHASISSDGKTLYFTSNRDGGYGGLDIYKSELDDNDDWGPARNLGSEINTPFNEETPIINVDNELLYFSSQGHLSMGGYDIFYSLRRDDKRWRTPINMGAPVCTTDDDLFYYPLDEHVSGLMSRIEDSSLGYDIYRYNSIVFANTPRFSVRGKADGIDSTNYEKYQLSVVNKETGDTLNNIPLTPGGDYEAILPVGNFDLVINDTTGIRDLAQVELTDESPESILLPGTEEPDTTEEDDKEEQLLALETEEQDDTEPEVIPEVQTDTVKLIPVLYRFDAYSLTDEYVKYLDEIQAVMIDNPDLNFTVEGHTDAMGPASYNLYLSQKRAQTVVDYLTARDISGTRLETFGKGEEFPIAINTNPDGTDSLHGRRYNRRVLLIPASTPEGLIFVTVNPVPEKYMIRRSE